MKLCLINSRQFALTVLVQKSLCRYTILVPVAALTFQKRVHGSIPRVAVAVVAGFPLGASATEVKLSEARFSLDNGGSVAS